MNKVLSKVFLWLFVGLALTFGVGYYVSTNETMLYNIFSDGKFLIFAIVEIVLAIILAARIHKLSTMSATIIYLLYTGFSGLTFSSIFVVYEITSIIFVFGITAVVCLLFGLIGYFTKIDLSKFGTFLFMAVFGLILAYVANIFIRSAEFDFVLTAIGIVIFLAYAAYDIQAIKRNLYGVEDEDNQAIIGALNLYIDFINVFIYLLKLFGNSKD